MIDNSDKRVPIIKLEKLYEEKYIEPISVHIRTSTRIERKVKDVLNYYSE